MAARETDVERRLGRGDDDDEEEDADEEGADASGADEEPKPQLWVFDLERGGDARQVTDPDEGVAEFDWGPEGDRVVVASRDPTEEQEWYLAHDPAEGDA